MHGFFLSLDCQWAFSIFANSLCLHKTGAAQLRDRPIEP